MLATSKKNKLWFHKVTLNSDFLVFSKNLRMDTSKPQLFIINKSNLSLKLFLFKTTCFRLNINNKGLSAWQLQTLYFFLPNYNQGSESSAVIISCLRIQNFTWEMYILPMWPWNIQYGCKMAEKWVIFFCLSNVA